MTKKKTRPVIAEGDNVALSAIVETLSETTATCRWNHPSLGVLRVQVPRGSLWAKSWNTPLGRDPHHGPLRAGDVVFFEAVVKAITALDAICVGHDADTALGVERTLPLDSLERRSHLSFDVA